MKLTVETELQDDGRWIAEVPEIPGAMVYAASREEALRDVQALALKVLSERMEPGEAWPSRLIQQVRLAKADEGLSGCHELQYPLDLPKR